MGLQISRSVHSEMQKENTLPAATETSGVWRKGTEFRGSAFLGPGILRTTVGRDERLIREYIRSQEKEDERLDQLNLWR